MFGHRFSENPLNGLEDLIGRENKLSSVERYDPGDVRNVLDFDFWYRGRFLPWPGSLHVHLNDKAIL